MRLRNDEEASEHSWGHARAASTHPGPHLNRSQIMAFILAKTRHPRASGREGCIHRNQFHVEICVRPEPGCSSNVDFFRVVDEGEYPWVL